MYVSDIRVKFDAPKTIMSTIFFVVFFFVILCD